ncbi:DUF1003 domain-containing protein [Luteolibacter sp. AS25]|uniref:DUF1003 domain-containing protein n=1 Tax=Luteolibacter sp. AS25 TaxID=3135776 RepID=UPI00398B6A54
MPETPKKSTQRKSHNLIKSGAHLFPVFGSDTFGKKAESFARFFGTPTFLIGQTLIVATWIFINVAGIVKFDLYPFILLNLAFSLQAAYAAPLILLAQTRQADRDKLTADADSLHREELANLSIERQAESIERLELIQQLITKNTELTETTQQLSARIAELSSEIRNHLKDKR